MGEASGLRFFLMDDGRVIERDHEPEDWREGYHSLAEMYEALIHQRIGEDIDDSRFREALMSIAEDLAATARATYRLLETIRRADWDTPRPSPRRDP